MTDQIARHFFEILIYLKCHKQISAKRGPNSKFVIEANTKS